MHYLPFVRPRFAPKEGEKYELKHLQPTARKLFERTSELTKIPVKVLLPWKMNKRKNLRKIGLEHIATGLRGYSPGGVPQYLDRFHLVYRPIIHSMWPYPFYRQFVELVVPALQGFRNSATQHEHIHALTNLLGRKRADRVDAFIHKGIEESFANLGIMDGYYEEQYEKEARSNVGNVHSTFGTDGLLALMASREEIKVPSDIPGVAGKLGRKGYLNEKGFTPEGEKWFAKRARLRILKKLVQIRKHRRECDLPIV